MPFVRGILAVAQALKAAVTADAAFAGVGISRSFPTSLGDEAFWASYISDAERKPAASNLRLFSAAPQLRGAGISVSKYLQNGDWTPLETRFLVLTDAFEAILAANPTLSGACSEIWIGHADIIETLDGESKYRLTALFDLSVTLYA